MSENVEISNRFLFCPYDGSQLERTASPLAPPAPRCPRCGFVDYQNPKPCVGVIIQYHDSILLARRGGPPMKGALDIPGGFIEAGETVEDAVTREIFEETGLRITAARCPYTGAAHPGEFRYLASFADEYGPRRVPTENLIFFVTSDTDLVTPASDVAELHWFPVNRIPSGLAFRHQHLAIQKYLESFTSSGSR